MNRITVSVALFVILSFLSSCNILDSSSGKCGSNYAFIEGMPCWDARGIDLVVGNDEVEWAVEHAPEMGNKTPGSVQLFLQNDTDAGKIWMERSFTLAPEKIYQVEVSYSFGTSDYGFIQWKMITGVHKFPPQEHDDLTYQGKTGTGFNEDRGIVWLDKSYSFVSKTNEDGDLYVAIGVWGTWETPRTYYVDDLDIEIRPVSSINV